MSRSFVILLALLGCDGHGLAPVDVAPVDAALADAPAIDVAFPPPACTPGADQTCNADPAMSGLAGYCNSYGTCMCLAGFTYDSGTRRCRPQRSCPTVAGEAPEGASGPPICRDPCPGEWATMVPLDTSDCMVRTSVDCPAGDRGVARMFLGVAQDCRIHSYVYLRVDFSMGCPSRLLVRARGGLAQDRIDCLTAALSGQRWQCALDATCTMWEMEMLP
ncbi:MAG TPA: hypothetical protein VN914_21640 [Polyangia bacterium]|nr:hypothetical protein [Polyangia bacterium]